MDSVTAEYFINSCCEKIDCRAENALYNKKQQLMMFSTQCISEEHSACFFKEISVGELALWILNQGSVALSSVCLCICMPAMKIEACLYCCKHRKGN